MLPQPHSRISATFENIHNKGREHINYYLFSRVPVKRQLVISYQKSQVAVTVGIHIDDRKSSVDNYLSSKTIYVGI